MGMAWKVRHGAGLDRCQSRSGRAGHLNPLKGYSLFLLLILNSFLLVPISLREVTPWKGGRMLEYPALEVKVWGVLACFTRPEMKVERVSYEVITPSAARGVLEAIFWKPEFAWQVREIWVLRPIRHFSILRNEVKSKAVVSTARGWAEEGGGYFAEDDRAQRHTLALRDVAYLIKADIVLKPHATDDIAKYRDQFRR